MTKVKGLILFRVILTVILLGSFFVLKVGPHPFLYPSLTKYIVYSIFILSFFYFVVLRYIKNLRIFTYIQLFLDSIIIIALILVTGGVESWFSFLMILNVIAAAIVIGRAAGYITATFLSILYGILIDLQFYKAIPVPYDTSLKATHFLYNLFIHISALYLIAYLAGYLTSRLERTSKGLEKVRHDLSELKALHTVIVENVPSGIVTTDSFGKIIAFNTQAEQITGIKRQDALGKNLTNLFPFLRGYFESNPGSRIRTEGIANNRIIGITMDSFEADGSKGFIGVFQDLTDIKKAEEEAKRKEKLAAIGELSRNIAHEIRNPLASLKGSVEMLIEDRVSEKQKKRLMEIALKEMDRLNKIITDFLLYTRPASLSFKRFDLGSLIDEVVIMLKTLNKAEKVDIKKYGPEHLEIMGDEAQLKQVFLNLGYNALEAMPEGGRLDISVLRNTDMALITFSDSGQGIKDEEIDKIFYPFYTTKEGGSGLGLSIAYKIIEEHHGKISVRSSSTGTTFEVRIPLTQISEEPGNG